MKDVLYLLLIEAKKNTFNQISSKLISYAESFQEMVGDAENDEEAKILRGKEELIWELLDTLNVTVENEVEEIERKMSCSDGSSEAYFQFLTNSTLSS